MWESRIVERLEPKKQARQDKLSVTPQALRTPAENRRRNKRLRTFRSNERLFASFHVSLQMGAMRKLIQQREHHENSQTHSNQHNVVAAKRASSAQGVARGRLRHQVQQDHLLKRLSPSPLSSARVEFLQHPDSIRPNRRPPEAPRSQLITAEYDVFQHPSPQRGLLPFPSARLTEAPTRRPWTAPENSLSANLTACRLKVGKGREHNSEVDLFPIRDFTIQTLYVWRFRWSTAEHGGCSHGECSHLSD